MTSTASLEVRFGRCFVRPSDADAFRFMFSSHPYSDRLIPLNPLRMKTPQDSPCVVVSPVNAVLVQR